MKYFFSGLAGLLAMGCQPQTHPQAVKNAPKTAAVAVSSAPAATPAPAPASGLASLDTLPAALQKLMQANDLTPLLQTVKADGGYAQNGFFGPEHRRIEFAFTDVQRDPDHPNVYYLQGKDRYKGQITEFAGKLIIDRFGQRPTYAPEQLAALGGAIRPEDKNARTNLTEGHFVLREDPAERGAGVFRGRLSIDWMLDEEGAVELDDRGRPTFSRHSGLKYEGTWTSARTHRVCSVVWVEDIFSYSYEQNVLTDFNVGERGPEINPKYARLGWNDYWENKEWWADSKRQTKASASTSAAAADTISNLGI